MRQYTLLTIVGVLTLLLGICTSQSVWADTPPDGFSFISSCGTVSSNAMLANDITAATGDCLTIGANGVTIDGNGFQIFAPGGKAVNIIQRSSTSIRNLRTSSGVQIYGADSHHTLIENSTFGSLGMYFGVDDTTIRNNQFGSIAALAEHPSTDPIQRITLTGNTIESANNKILWIQTGVGKAGQDPELFPCMEGQHVIEDNTLISHFTGDATSEPAIFTLRCSSHDIIRGNTMIADGEATGIYLRDEANHSLYENNSIWTTAEDSSGPLFSGGGWNVYGQPSYNIFRNNTFHSAGSRAIWFHGIGVENLLERNVFYSSYWEGGRIAGGGANVFDHNTFYNDQPGNVLVFDNLRPPANVYTNNIYEMDNSTGKRMFEFDHQPDFAGYSASHNVYYNRAGSVMFQDPANGTGPGWNLAQWQAQTNETGSREGDPFFVDPANYNFHIGEMSVARGADEDGGDAGAFSYSDDTPALDVSAPATITNLLAN